VRYALLIPGWFPSEVNFLAGDFIERHARAASEYFPVKVLFIIKNESLLPGTIMLRHVVHTPNYETFIYHYASSSSSRRLQKIFSGWMQARCLIKGYRQMVKKYGPPSLIHAHVLIKNGWFAWLKSKQHHIPLLASEQWTGYLQEAQPEFDRLSGYQKRILSAIFRRAVHVTTVSEYLAQAIRKRFSFKTYSVIPNLVDTSLFQPREKTEGPVTNFIHISTLSFQKNFDELLEACVVLKQAAGDFHLTVIAPVNEAYRKKVMEAKLINHISFKNEMPQGSLRELVAASDALVLYSNYETFGCVIVEANACGVPVIVSDCPVFNENVEEGVTGFKVPLHHPEALADCMMKIINKDHIFDKQTIIDITTEKYSSEVIGKQFARVYNQYAKP
jgi:glycosyltransferase involved in cell wall biosynthesis